MVAYIHAIVWNQQQDDGYTVKTPDGNFYDLYLDIDLNIGDAIRLDPEDLSYIGNASSNSTRRNDLGTVKEELDSDFAFVEISGHTQKVWNPNQIAVQPGDVVEIGAAGTIIDNYPDTDISFSLFDRDIDALISSFKEGKEDENENEDEDEEDNLTFDDFGGMTRAQREFRERVQLFLTESDKIEEIGTELRMGALFYGPPGTGKSHFARILSDSLNAQFYRVRGPEIVSKGVGDTEELIREIFDDAEKESPAIIFFDEIDSIAMDRGSSSGSNDFSERIVAQLLSVIDGFDKAEENVFVIAATNQKDEIDEALLREGRFDWKVHFPRPDEKARGEIFQALEDDYVLSDSVSEEDKDKIIAQTEGWTGAKLRALLNEAGLLAVGEGRDEIRYTDIVMSFERVQFQDDPDEGS